MEESIILPASIESQDLLDTFCPTAFDMMSDLLKKDELLSSAQYKEDTRSPADTDHYGQDQVYGSTLDVNPLAIEYNPNLMIKGGSYPPSVGSDQPGPYPVEHAGPSGCYQPPLGPHQPVERLGPPDQTPDPGQFNFTAELCTTPSNNKCLYSKRLNKIYVDIGADIPFQFGWTDADRTMYVRACVVYVDKEHADKRVHCCLQHRQPNDPEHIASNVLHATRAHSYSGQAADAWYTVLGEFAPGAAKSQVFQFVCKNSCSTGINRRAIGIVFTLEDCSGTVYGRQVVNARVCSCPTRDRRKDESDAPPRAAKRPAPAPATPAAPPPRAKVKLEPRDAADPDLALYPLPDVQVVGRHTLIAGLEMMARMTEQACALARDAAHRAACARSLDALRRLVASYRQ